MTWSEPRLKFFGVPLQKLFHKNPDGTLIVRGFFTSDNKDEVGDIITRSATERALPKYRQWGNIRRMHLPEPVAVVLRIGTDDGLAWNEVEIKVIDPRAVFEVENGLLKALSVGIFMRYEDVDFLEDGGLIINDYTLAEISLVDHPANYDAVLQRGATDGVRMLVRQYGMDSVARSFQKILDSEVDVEQDELVTNDPLETDVDAPEAEQELDKTASVDAEVEQNTQEETPAEEEAPEATPVEPEVEDDAKVLLRSLIDQVAQLANEVSLLRTLSATPAEAQPAQSGGEGDDGDSLADAGVPTGRVGGVEATEALSEKDIPAPQKHASLRDALTKYFQSRS